MEQELYVTDLKVDERKDIQAEIDAAIADIRAGHYAQELLDAGLAQVDATVLTESPWRLQSGQQLTGLEVVLITLVAKEGIKVGDKVLSDLWTHIVFPRIKARYGTRVSRVRPRKH